MPETSDVWIACERFQGIGRLRRVVGYIQQHRGTVLDAAHQSALRRFHERAGERSMTQQTC